MSKNQYHDEGPARKYWIQLPNMIDDSDLDVYEFRLYAHYKRVAGDDGKCWQSKQTVATLCGMSAGKASAATRSLEKRGLITIEEVPSGRGQPYHVVRIIDIWPRNMALYNQNSQGDAISSPHELIGSSGELIGSPDEIKNNPLGITPKKKNVEKKKKKNFLAEPQQTNRERILNILSDVLDTPLPADHFLYKRWEKGLDSIIINCLDIAGKKRLDSELTSEIVAAIRLGVEQEEWAFRKADYPNTPVVSCIPRLLRQYRKKGEATRQARTTATRRNEAALQAAHSRQQTRGDPWWDNKLEELRLQMDAGAFNAWLKKSTARQENGNVIITVQNEQAREWLVERLMPVLERALDAEQIEVVSQ